MCLIYRWCLNIRIPFRHHPRVDKFNNIVFLGMSLRISTGGRAFLVGRTLGGNLLIYHFLVCNHGFGQKEPVRTIIANLVPKKFREEVCG